MKTYTLIGTVIQIHPNVTSAKKALASADGEPKILLASQDDLAGAELLSTDLIAIWNALPGVEPVKKFTSRKIAVERIWREIAKLEPESASQRRRAGEKAAEDGGEAGVRTHGPTAAKASKQSAVLDLLRRPDGATLAELMAATGWQAHSIRGFLSGTVRKKMSLKPQRFERDGGEKAYRLEN